MRCAIVHYWLTGMRGGERVIEGLCKLMPEADIFTLFYDPEQVSPIIRRHNIKTSFLSPLRRFHRHTLPLMPFALEQFDLRSYDLVISSESGPAKGVITSGNTRHVCYCHSPMRYLWDLYPTYLHDWTTTRHRRALLALFSNYLRVWDYASASRVDDFLANSVNVQKRVWKAYRRTSEVVYPPVNTETFWHARADDYYLVVSALVEYKRVRDAVACFARNGRKLKIVGEGPQYRELRRLASSNIEFCGRVPERELRSLYAHCRAVLLPGEEDFGIVPVESLASGKHVIAFGQGGVLESVPASNPRAGFFYSEAGPDGLGIALRQFEMSENQVNPVALQRIAKCFSMARFAGKMRAHLGLDEVAHSASATAAAT